jgi:predicted GNAT family N-acyltransferase
MPEILIRTATERADREACFAIRLGVFVEEQGVPRAAELDEHDLPGAATVHLLALVDGQPAGAMRWRTAPPGTAKIERVAVLAAARGLGIGRLLMGEALRQVAAAGLGSAVLHAQTSARAFYERLGFLAEGDTFDEDGIEHVRMWLEPVRDR